MNKKEKEAHLKSLYLKAIDDTTPSEELSKIWHETTSVRIRKAVPSNPNASISLLREAARLYLEEVLTNPSFELLTLFSTTQDEWTTNISQACENPQKYLSDKSAWFFSQKKLESALRACLCSDNLTTQGLLKTISFMNRSSLKRSMKNKEVKSKVRNLLLSMREEHLSYIQDYPFILVSLFLEDVLSTEEINHIINHFPLFNTYFRAEYFRTIFKKTILDYTKEVQNYEYTPKSTQKHIKLACSLILCTRNFLKKHLGWYILNTCYEKKVVTRNGRPVSLQVINHEKTIKNYFSLAKFSLEMVKELRKIEKNLGQKNNLKKRLDAYLLPFLEGTVQNAFTCYYGDTAYHQIYIKNLQEFYEFLDLSGTKETLISIFGSAIQSRGKWGQNTNPRELNARISHRIKSLFPSGLSQEAEEYFLQKVFIC